MTQDVKDKPIRFNKVELEFTAGEKIETACLTMYEFFCKHGGETITVFNGIRITMEDQEFYKKFKK